MSSPVRWLLVVLVTLAVIAPAALPRVLPASASHTSAVDLARAARHSTVTGWSGEVRTLGTLGVPKIGNFGGVARLFGSDSDLRVFWRDKENWRIDRLRTSGEEDLVRNGGQMTTWTYESKRATSTTADSTIRLPDVSDVLPSTIAARLLVGAKMTQLERLPADRVDGRSAAGLRFSPTDPRATLDHLDLWIDEDSGLPLRALVYADGADVPILTSTLTNLHLGRPSAEHTRFAFPDGIRVRSTYAIDEVAGANAFAPFDPPSSLAGLSRQGTNLGAVGVYGRGATALIAVPLRRRVAREVYRQIAKSKDAEKFSEGTIGLVVGPLSLRLATAADGRFLLAGFVTPATLESAAQDLQSTTFRPRRTDQSPDGGNG